MALRTTKGRGHRGAAEVALAPAGVLLAAVLALAVPLVLAGAPADAEESTEASALSTLTVSAVDPSGVPVPGVGFALWSESNGAPGLQQARPGDTDLGMSCTTDAAGTCTVGTDATGAASLPIGTYYWVQTTTPEGYQAPVDAAQPQGTVSVTAENAGTASEPTVVRLVAEQADSATVEDETDQSSETVDGASSGTTPTVTDAGSTPTDDPAPSSLPQEQGTEDSPSGTSLQATALLAPLQVTVACETGTTSAVVAGFEIDGNLCVDGATDWDSPVGDTEVDGTDDSTGFTGGSSENVDPSDWTINDETTPNDKNDIDTAYAWSQKVGDDVYAYFGLTGTSDLGGTGQINLEYNQQDNDTVNGWSVPNRTPGDLLFQFEGSGSDAVQFETAHQYTLRSAPDWSNGSCFAVGGSSPEAGWCSITIPLGAYTSSLNDDGTFAEGAINLTQLLGVGDTCSATFGQVNMRSVTGGSLPNASLKDYVAPLGVTTPSTCPVVTLQKTWVDGVQGDTAELAINDGTSATSTADGTEGPWTDSANQATAEFEDGEDVTVTETLAPDNTGTYDTSLACTTNGVEVAVGADGSFTMPTTDVTCTFTNDWLEPRISVVKQAWNDETEWGHGIEELQSGTSSVISGTTITWTYLVKNTGQTTLSDIVVTDDRLGDSRTGFPPPISCPKTSLAVGASMICTASGPVTAD